LTGKKINEFLIIKEIGKNADYQNLKKKIEQLVKNGL